MLPHLHSVFSAFLLLLTVASAGLTTPAMGARPNVLIITVDDMNADSMGTFGCSLADTTPNMDRLARQGLRFRHAHVQVGNCMPSRNVMWSGLYPHNNGVEGFYQVKTARHPHLVDVMKAAGYFTAIRNKVSHSTPYSPYAWDLILDVDQQGQKLHIKDVKSYGASTARGIAAATKAGKPFCVMLNISDPHKPFFAYGKNGQTVPDKHKPSKVFSPNEVPVPGFLFDDRVVRKELAHYYSSVRRADDCVGEILEALEASDKRDDTLVLFLSDHGMPLPFAKTQLYHHSTHTPLVVRWPGKTKAGSIDSEHMVSAVDFLPTLMEAIDVKPKHAMDGRSFLPLLTGGKQQDRKMVFKEYNENAGASRDPMRAVQTKQYLYIFNPWSNGERVMATATSGTPTYRRMTQLAKSNRQLAQRHALYRHRVVEELYDVQRDPDCLHNLIGQPRMSEVANGLRKSLAAWLAKTEDPLADVFSKRDDAAAMEAYVVQVEKEALQRRAKKRKQKPKKPNKSRKNVGKAKLQFTKLSVEKDEVVVDLGYRLHADIGRQKLHVTLKGADNKRIERKVVTVAGSGEEQLRFRLPERRPIRFRVAAFVGDDFQSNIEYLVSPPVRISTAKSEDGS